MTYKTLLTSKGTTTVPIEIRQKLGLQPGMYVSFVQNPHTGEYIIRRSQTIDEIRLMNQQALRQAGTTHLDHTAVDAFPIDLNENGTV